MSYKVYFLKTFPSEAIVSELFKLFTRLSWEIDRIEFRQQKVADFLGKKENLVLISPEIEEVGVFFNEGFVNVYLPLNTTDWPKVEELIERKSYLLRTFNLQWETIEEDLKPLEGKIKYFLTPKGVDIETQNREIFEKLQKTFEGETYSTDLKELEETIGELLKEKGLTIATAESCTGGLVAARLVNVSGSSEYFKGSVVAYSNEVKQNLLKVNPQTLEKYGAVSAQTAKEMAEGVKSLLNTDIGISTTGIAGPGGGTPEKPVGLTYFAVSLKDRTEVFKYVFPFDRNQNRIAASQFVLFKLYQILKEI
jgi:PncC family amidohydrolase